MKMPGSPGKRDSARAASGMGKDININSVYEFFLMFLWVVSNIYFISISIFKTFRN